MMKKSLVSISLALCLMCSTFLFSACDDKKKENDVVVEVTKYTLTVENGTGSGTFVKDENVTVVANKKDEYVFDGWKIGTKIVSDKETYTFKITSDTTISATYSYPYSIWNGETPAEAPASYIVNEEAKTVDINDAEAFAWWRSLCVATSATEYYKGFAGKTHNNTLDFPLTPEDADYKLGFTININCNLDLTGQTWVGIDAEAAIFDGCTINGNGHTIKGMNTKGQPAAAGYRGWATGGFFTMVGSNQDIIIKDLTFKNASAVGGGQLAILIGGTYRADITLDNVDVINSYINSGTGHKTGILIGRVGNCGDGTGDHEKITIKNCDVQGTTVVGMRNIGGLVGTIFSSAKSKPAVYNNPLWAALIGNTALLGANYPAFDNTTKWWENALKSMKEIVNSADNNLVEGDDGYKANNTNKDIPTLKTQIAQYQGFYENHVKTEREFYNSDIKKNLKLEYNYVTDCTFVTYATTLANVGYMLNFNESTNFDNAQAVSVNSLGNNMTPTAAATNKTYNTVSFVNNLLGQKPIYMATASDFSEMFSAYMYETSREDGYEARDIYITCDLDFTELLKNNAGFDKVVFTNTFTIYTLPGVKITGLPASVLANAVIVELAPTI